MEKWQSGDVEAFEDLFRRYEGVVFKNAYLITGNRGDAEDVLQNVFASVWKSRHTFDAGKGKITTWLHRITVNECYRRRRRDRPALPLDGIDPPDARQDVQAGVERREEYGRVLRAMETMDARHRAVLVLRYFNDLSYEEIARAAGVPLGTVKSRINHALKTLRARLDEPAQGQ